MGAICKALIEYSGHSLSKVEGLECNVASVYLARPHCSAQALFVFIKQIAQQRRQFRFAFGCPQRCCCLVSIWLSCPFAAFPLSPFLLADKHCEGRRDSGKIDNAFWH